MSVFRPDLTISKQWDGRAAPFYGPESALNLLACHFPHSFRCLPSFGMRFVRASPIRTIDTHLSLLAWSQQVVCMSARVSSLSLWVMETGSDLNPIHSLVFILAIAPNEKRRDHVTDLSISPCKTASDIYGLAQKVDSRYGSENWKMR